MYLQFGELIGDDVDKTLERIVVGEAKVDNGTLKYLEKRTRRARQDFETASALRTAAPAGWDALEAGSFEEEARSAERNLAATERLKQSILQTYDAVAGETDHPGAAGDSGMGKYEPYEKKMYAEMDAMLASLQDGSFEEGGDAAGGTPLPGSAARAASVPALAPRPRRGVDDEMAETELESEAGVDESDWTPASGGGVRAWLDESEGEEDMEGGSGSKDGALASDSAEGERHGAPPLQRAWGRWPARPGWSHASPVDIGPTGAGGGGGPVLSQRPSMNATAAKFAGAEAGLEAEAEAEAVGTLLDRPEREVPGGEAAVRGVPGGADRPPQVRHTPRKPTAAALESRPTRLAAPSGAGAAGPAATGVQARREAVQGVLGAVAGDGVAEAQLAGVERPRAHSSMGGGDGERVLAAAPRALVMPPPAPSSGRTEALATGRRVPVAGASVSGAASWLRIRPVRTPAGSVVLARIVGVWGTHMAVLCACGGIAFIPTSGQSRFTQKYMRNLLNTVKARPEPAVAGPSSELRFWDLLEDEEAKLRRQHGGPLPGEQYELARATAALRTLIGRVTRVRILAGPGGSSEVVTASERDACPALERLPERGAPSESAGDPLVLWHLSEYFAARPGARLRVLARVREVQRTVALADFAPTGCGFEDAVAGVLSQPVPGDEGMDLPPYELPRVTGIIPLNLWTWDADTEGERSMQNGLDPGEEVEAELVLGEQHVVPALQRTAAPTICCIVLNMRNCLERPSTSARDPLLLKALPSSGESSAGDLPPALARYLRRLASLPRVIGVAVDVVASDPPEDPDAQQSLQVLLGRPPEEEARDTSSRPRESLVAVRRADTVASCRVVHTYPRTALSNVLGRLMHAFNSQLADAED